MLVNTCLRKICLKSVPMDPSLGARVNTIIALAAYFSACSDDFGLHIAGARIQAALGVDTDCLDRVLFQVVRTRLC